MKINKARIFVVAIILFIVLIFSFGIQIGNVRIGKQIDLKVPQNENFDKSKFKNIYYSKKNLIVLNIWATWCRPCVDEIPLLNSIKKNFKGETVHFLSLSIDKDSLKLQHFLDKKQFNFKDITIENLEFIDAILNTLENKPTGKWISSYTIPITYIIKNKKVIKKINGQIDEKELIKYINQNK
jgi:thiol-disulfide isomerase/thioredoxin